LLFHPSPESLYLGVDDEAVEEAELYTWLAKELGVAPPEEAGEDAETNRRREVGSKRCSNRRLRESGYSFRYPTYRDGYAALIRARPTA
jgi:hypothetical protein